MYLFIHSLIKSIKPALQHSVTCLIYYPLRGGFRSRKPNTAYSSRGRVIYVPINQEEIIRLLWMKVCRVNFWPAAGQRRCRAPTPMQMLSSRAAPVGQLPTRTAATSSTPAHQHLRQHPRLTPRTLSTFTT